MDGKPLGQQFSDDLFDVIDKYLNQGMTFAEIIGHIEHAKLSFFNANLDDDEVEPWKRS